MKKKFVFILTAIMLCLCFALAFTACTGNAGGNGGSGGGIEPRRNFVGTGKI